MTEQQIIIRVLNKVIENQKLLFELHAEHIERLTVAKEVAIYLGLSTRTIYNYIKSGKLVKDEHYYTDGYRYYFIPEAIVKFKHARDTELANADHNNDVSDIIKYFIKEGK